MPQLCEVFKNVQKPWQTQEVPRHNFKHQLREKQSPQMVSEMFRKTKLLAASWTLLGEGAGLRVSAKAVICQHVHGAWKSNFLE